MALGRVDGCVDGGKETSEGGWEMGKSRGIADGEVRESYAAAKRADRKCCARRVSRRAYLRALTEEGPHVATADGEEWWRDQERRFPGICAGGNRPDGTDSRNGHRNRHGKVSLRSMVVDGVLVRERWTKDGWERE